MFVNGDEVYLLHIEHKHGDDYYLYLTEEEARASLDEYVREYWESDGPLDHDGVVVLMPDTRDERIAAYYHDTDEWYVIKRIVVGS